MREEIDIQPEHIKIVRNILRHHLPLSVNIWVFGSRALKQAKKYSDLDLAIDLGKPLSLELLAKLQSDFEESNLPYKVDIVDWQTISPEFRAIVQKDKKVFSL